MKYLDERELLSEDQHGFRAGRSCATQLLEIVEIWTGMLDEGGGIDVVYLDFKKAFDSVPHRRLLKKLEAYGINVKWAESFLMGRKQKVVDNGRSSPWKEEVLSGIPQAACLDPFYLSILLMTCLTLKAKSRFLLTTPSYSKQSIAKRIVDSCKRI